MKPDEFVLWLNQNFNSLFVQISKTFELKYGELSYFDGWGKPNTFIPLTPYITVSISFGIPPVIPTFF